MGEKDEGEASKTSRDRRLAMLSLRLVKGEGRASVERSIATRSHAKQGSHQKRHAARPRTVCKAWQEEGTREEREIGMVREQQVQCWRRRVRWLDDRRTGPTPCCDNLPTDMSSEHKHNLDTLQDTSRDTDRQLRLSTLGGRPPNPLGR